MDDTRRWIIAILAALVVVGLVMVARGRDHHRGDDVGALADSADPPADAGVSAQSGA